MKNKFRLSLLIVLLSLVIIKSGAYAKDLDEIKNYEITADVNSDATVTLTYHIEWEVLDSSSEGPLSWVKIGIPNSHVDKITPLTGNITSAKYNSSGGYYVNLYLDRSYYAGEVITFEFSIKQDYLYKVNKYTEGETNYTFTPGWFDDTKVDKLTVKWNFENATSWNPDASIEAGYLTWRAADFYGKKLTVEIVYPNDAYGFDLTKTDEGTSTSSSSEGGIFEALMGLLCCGGFAAIIFAPIIAIIKDAVESSSGRGFGSGTTKKITRTKIVYHETCPGCGAAREEGKESCMYCGRSLVQSKETITEEELKKEDAAAAKHNKTGEYRYSSSPNTYVRVNVVNIPRPKPSCVTSSCAHSSCACASHCACACACACAGGGRAGCTNKDFYNTNLKLKILELKSGSKKK